MGDLYLFYYIEFHSQPRINIEDTLLVAQLFEALRYKPEGYDFDSGWCHCNLFIEIIFPAALWPWG
jgi:hypothetical protein